MENDFQQKFAAWPFRFYGILNGTILGFKAQPEANEKYAFDVTSVADWLQSLKL